MDGLLANDQNPQQLGEEWIRALIEKNFRRLAGLCHPDVRSRLMTPKRFDSFENATGLTQKVEEWFGECYSIEKEGACVTMVGKKLAIFYRLRFEENGMPHTAEQQLYCSLRDGRIDQLSLLCSGFQLDQASVEVPVAQALNSAATIMASTAQPALQAHALLEVGVAGGQESTCAILTPSIKRKLDEMSSGQVLEVHVDDPTAKEDIEAWCRLSGNSLLKIDQGKGQALHFYLRKK
jgi:tRNA 2-thiouridine synthesizing protein A